MEKNTKTRLNYLKGELFNLSCAVESRIGKKIKAEWIIFDLIPIMELLDSIIEEQEELEKWRKKNI